MLLEGGQSFNNTGNLVNCYVVFLGYNSVCYGLKYPGDFRRKGEGSSRNTYKRPTDKPRTHRIEGGRVGGWGEGRG